MPERLCMVCGKIPTNYPSGKCVMCMINGSLPVNLEQAKQKELRCERSWKKVIYPSKETGKKEEVMPVTEENKGRKCSVEDCFKFTVKAGMCTKHYNEAHGIEKRRRPKRKDKNNTGCSVDGCGNTVKSGGLCNKHYLRELKAKGRIGKNKRGRQMGSLRSHKSPDIIGTGSIPRLRRVAEETAPATNSHVSIDLTAFPKINKFVSALPEIPAGDMLGVLLKQRLNELEERIAI